MGKNFLSKFKAYLNENFILSHVAICFIGFIFVLLTQLYVNIPETVIDYFSPFTVYYFPHKKVELISYLVLVPTLFTLFLLYIPLYINKDKIKSFFKGLYSEKFVLSFLIFDVITNIILSIKMGRYLNYSLCILSIWLLVFILPFIKLIKSNIDRSSLKKTLKIFEKVIIILFFIFTVYNLINIFKPFAIDKLFIYHEFSQIPQSTTMEHSIVDNLEYIEKNQVYGNRKIYDIRNPEKSLDGPNCVEVSNPDIKNELNSIVEKQHVKIKFCDKTKAVRTFFYSSGNKVCSISKLNRYEIIYLKSNIYPTFSDDFDKIIQNNYKITGPYAGGQSFWEVIKDADFLSKNRQNMVSDYIGLWFHHQNHIMSPISRVNLGQQPNDIFMQYGYGTTLLMQKTLNHFKGFNLGDYFKVLNLFCYVYYFAFLAVLFVIFKKPTIALSAWGLILIPLNKFLYIHWYIAPGANPIRHFFDIFAIFFFYLYLINHKKVNLIVVDLLCLCGIFVYPMYGLFLSMALVAASLIRLIAKKSKFELTNALIFSIVSLIAYKLFSVGVDLSSSNFFNGLSGFLTTKKIILLIFTLIACAYALIIKNIKVTSPYKDLLLFLVLYVQGILLYFLAISEMSHFLVLTPVYIFTFFVFIQLFKESFSIKDNSFEIFNLIIFLLVAAILSFVSFPAHLNDVYVSKVEIKYHPIYEWNIPNSNFKSDMNPKYFADSIKLLKRKEYSVENKIYMISEYDNFLPLLADKYNAFSYIDLQWYVSQPKVYNEIKSQLISEKPKYIFVDKYLTTDKIESTVFHVPLPQNEGYFEVSLLKYLRLRTLKSLFDEISEDYTPIESSYLLTVYERKNDK